MSEAHSSNVSIAVVSNPLSVIMANKILFDYKKSSQNILIIDYGKKKESFIQEIKSCANRQNWTKVIDLSELVVDAHDSKPGLRKRLTRKYKSLPLLKPFYSILQKRALKKIETTIQIQLNHELKPFLNSKETNLFLLTQTYSNGILKKLFPTAIINYYEHGIGDYVLSAQMPELMNTHFYGIFAREYKAFDLKSKLNYTDIEFHSHKKPESTAKRNKALIILQNLEIYCIDILFWKNYFDNILENEHETFQFIIKPHPLQSNQTITFITDYFTLRKLNFEILPFAKGIELEFESFHDSIKSVYSPFSSSLFYLSKIYADDSIDFYQSLNRVHKLIGKAPEQYKKHFEQNHVMVKNVFGKNCKEF